MSLVKQLLAVVVLCGLGVVAYRYGWPLVAPAGGDRAAQGRPDGPAAEGRRGGDRVATVLVEAVELQAERTRIPILPIGVGGCVEVRINGGHRCGAVTVHGAGDDSERRVGV